MTVTTQIIMISTVVKKVLKKTMIHIKASSHKKEMADEEERKHGDSDSRIFFVHEIVGDSFGLDLQIRIETVLATFDFLISLRLWLLFILKFSGPTKENCTQQKVETYVKRKRFENKLGDGGDLQCND